MNVDRNHFDSYALLNDQLLGLIMADKGESNEADVIRDEMDIHWNKMNICEQNLILNIWEQNLIRKRNETKMVS